DLVADRGEVRDEPPCRVSFQGADGLQREAAPRDLLGHQPVQEAEAHQVVGIALDPAVVAGIGQQDAEEAQGHQPLAAVDAGREQAGGCRADGVRHGSVGGAWGHQGPVRAQPRASRLSYEPYRFLALCRPGYPASWDMNWFMSK